MPERQISSTFDRYKTATNLFVRWIFNQMKKCGYFGSSSLGNTTGSSKRRARKKNEHGGGSRNMRITITTEELLSMVQFLANTTLGPKETIVPEGVQVLLEQAIEGRKLASAWYFQHTQIADEGHEHYISVLEKIYDILKSRFASNFTTKEGSLSTEESLSTSVSILTVKTELDGASGRVKSFLTPPKPPQSTIEEEIKEGVKEVNQDGTEELSSATGLKEESPMCELETSDEAEIVFMAYCLFEDFHKISFYVQDLWNMVKAHTLDSAVASLMTDLAMDIIITSSKDLSTRMLNGAFNDDCHIIIKAVIAQAQNQSALSQEKKKKSAEIRITPSSLDKTSHLSEIHLSLERVYSSLLRFRNEVRIPQASSLENQKYTKNHLPKSDAVEQDLDIDDTAVGHDDTLMSNILQELYISHCWSNLSKVQGSDKRAIQVSEAPVFVITCINNLFTGKDITLSVVFCARILLMISTILEDHVDEESSKSRQILGKAMAAYGEEWDIKESGFIRMVSEKSIVPKESWPSEALRLQVKTLTRDAFLKDHVYRSTSKKAFSAQLVEKLKGGPKSTISNLPYTRHPLYSGMESMNMKIQMEEVGKMYANSTLAMIAMSHIYNAGRQKGKLKTSWQAMDAFIASRKLELFSGSLPTDDQKMYRRLMVCAGLPVAKVHSHNPRNTNSEINHLHTLKRAENLVKTSPASAFIKGYLQRVIGSEKLLCDIFKLQRKKNEKSYTSNYSAAQLLEMARDHIKDVIMPLIDEDLTALWLTSTEILDLIKHALGEALGPQDPIMLLNDRDISTHPTKA